jgi:hypothetical protein
MSPVVRLIVSSSSGKLTPAQATPSKGYFGVERPSSAAADVTTTDNPTTYFTAVSCSDWFGIKPPRVLYALFTNTNTFKPQFGLDAFYINSL